MGTILWGLRLRVSNEHQLGIRLQVPLRQAYCAGLFSQSLLRTSSCGTRNTLQSERHMAPATKISVDVGSAFIISPNARHLCTPQSMTTSANRYSSHEEYLGCVRLRQKDYKNAKL